MKKIDVAPGSIKGIHLDLKYQVPNKAYLMDWVKRLPGYGINALLIEYEDTFPFKTYPFLACKDAFTPDELKRFLGTAREAGLTLIPLVQTYAHLEFALTHPQLAHLREKPEIMTKICARKPEASRFVQDLLTDVLEYHKEDTFFHLGGDEVWHTGWCDACTKRLEEVGPAVMWSEHEKPLLEFMLARGKRPIIWDDIFWKEPEAVGRSSLPKETILHAWNYGITSLAPKKAEATHLEYGDTSSVLQQVDRYHEAGFQTLAAPCYNWGVLFGQHTHCLKNTQVWAQKAKATGMLGMLNTAWACFHIPLQVSNLHVKATGELLRNPDVTLDDAWQNRFLKDEFGVAAEGVPAALEVLGRMWEIPAPAFERPFTPLVYGYMSMVFHYPNRHKDRQQRGAYPRDWNEIDFTAMYLKGVESSRQYPEQGKLLEQLDERLAAFPPAVAAMQAFAAGATKHRDEAELMAVFARLKFLSLRIFAHLIRGDGEREALKRDVAALEAPLRKVMAQAWEPEGQARLWRAFFEPMGKLLEAGKGKS